jgi:2'-5' RNA ligase
MKQVITIFLQKDKNIELIRKKYIPNYKKIEPHITLVYPFEVKNQAKLKEHILNSINKVKPFEISLKGLKKSAKEYYLYLLVNEGKENILNLYNKLNSGVLKNFKNVDMPVYIAHLSLGVFGSEKRIEEAIKDISKMNISFKTKVKSIQLLTINEDESLKSKEDFSLEKE